MQFTLGRSRRDLGQDDALLRIAVGCYTPRVANDLPVWQSKQQMTLARCQAALHLVPSAIALTHESAAAVLGLSSLRAEPDVRVAVPPTQTRGRTRLTAFAYGPQGEVPGRSVVVRRSSVRPEPQEVITVQGMRVTDPLRTALDCACDLPVRLSLPIIDSAVRQVCRPDRRTRQATAATRIDEALARLAQMLAAQGPRRGICRARTAIALADPLAESPGESVLRWAAAAAGLPAPVTQLGVQASGHEYFLDLGFPQWHSGWEFDGLGKLAEASDLRAEKRRELRLGRSGWRLERFGWEEVHDGQRLVRRVRSLYPPSAYSGEIPRDIWR